MTFYRNLLLAALILTFGVVSLGAYVRLSDAGLGCPDWPGCYGKLTPHHAADAIDAELAERPDGPVSHADAVVVMVSTDNVSVAEDDPALPLAPFHGKDARLPRCVD